jgi:hypothetical protein
MEHAVLLGLAMTAFIFAYYAFQLKDSGVESNQRLAVLLAIVSLAFTNILFYSTYLIAQNTVPYLTGGFIEIGVSVMTWTTNLILAYMLVAAFYQLIKYTVTAFTDGMKGGRKKGGGRGEE